MTTKKKPGAQAPAKLKSGRDGYQVNLSEEEKALIDRGAALAGLERSAFMRSESVKAAHRLMREAVWSQNAAPSEADFFERGGIIPGGVKP